MKRFALLLLLLNLLGCGDIKVVPDKPFELSSVNHHKYIKSYTIGKQQTAYIGEPIVKWQHLFEIKDIIGDKYISKSDFTLKGEYLKRDMFSHNIDIKSTTQDAYSRFGTTNYNNIEYSVLGKINSENEYYLLIDNNGVLNKQVLIDENLDRKLLSKTVQASPNNVMFSKVAIEKVKQSEGTTHEIIFGGVNNITLSATYREYTPDNLARQAFYQNLVYQTSAEVIRFRGLKIKIHDVSNEKITYTVLEDDLIDTTTEAPQGSVTSMSNPY